MSTSFAAHFYHYLQHHMESSLSQHETGIQCYMNVTYQYKDLVSNGIVIM